MRLHCFVAMLLSGLLAASSARAEPRPLDVCGGDWTAWPAGNPATVWSLSSSAPSNVLSGPDVAAATQAAFAEWSRPGCTNFTAQQGNDTTASPLNTDDTVNAIGFVNSGWVYGQTTLAITVPVYWQDDCSIITADMVFNGQDHSWVMDAPQEWDESDYQSVATHEAGHWIGFDHNTFGGSSLNATYSGGLDERTLTCSDTEGVCQLYASTDNSCSAERYCACGIGCTDGQCGGEPGDDDDDDPICGGGPVQTLAESEPNDWLGEDDVDTLNATTGDLRYTGTVACGNDGESYNADLDWLVVDFPCTGDARFSVAWSSDSLVDFYVWGGGAQDPIASWESTTGSSPGTAEATTGNQLSVAVACWSGETAAYTFTVDWRPFAGAPGDDDDDGAGDDDDDDDDDDGAIVGSVRTDDCGCSGSAREGSGAATLMLLGLALLGRARPARRARRR